MASGISSVSLYEISCLKAAGYIITWDGIQMSHQYINIVAAALS